ncbi:MAG: glycosyltransferase [Actinomycetota bacterium]
MPDKRALLIVHSYYLRDTRPRRHAAALAGEGWKIDVVCARAEGERARERIGGVTVHRLPARRRRGTKSRYILEYVSFAVLAFAYATWLSVRRTYRVAYVVGIPNFIVFAAFVPKLLGARVILDMRDPLPEFFMSKYRLSARAPLVRALRLEERVSGSFATDVMTVVPSMARLYERSVPASKVTVVMNAPDPKMFAAEPREPGVGRTMLYTGTVSEHYGIDLAVRALARLRDEIPALRLRVVTKNVREEGVESLRALAQGEGVADRVAIEPPVPLVDVPSLIADAWVGVQPNRPDPLMEFSLSQKILEWVLAGLPVICGRTRALVDALGEDALSFHEAGDLDGLCARIREAHAEASPLVARAARARAAVEAIGYDEQIRVLRNLFEGSI